MDVDPTAVLSAEQSWDFLAGQQVGRLATFAMGDPEIFPVNYILTDQTLVFRTAQGTKLVSIVINNRVAFEVDEFFDDHAVSVVAKGEARLLDTYDEIEALGAERLRPFVPTLKQQFVAIDVAEITGRRFEFGPEPDRMPMM
jgi:uncharacterized protein